MRRSCCSQCAGRIYYSFFGKATRSQQGFIVYDWAESIYAVAASFFLPTYVSDLAEDAGFGSPKSFWTFASAAATLFSLVAYLTFCSVGGYGTLKISLSRRCAFVGAAFTAATALAVVPELVWWAAFAFIVARVSSRIAGLFMDATLLDVAHGDEHVAHNVSSKAVALGYVGMFVFTILMGPFLASGQSGAAATWLEQRVPLLLAGLWWAVFSVYAFRRLGKYPGRPLPEEASGSSWRLLRFSFSTGIREQWAAIRCARGGGGRRVLGGGR